MFLWSQHSISVKLEVNFTRFVKYLLALFCLCLQADLFPGALVHFGSDMKTGWFGFCCPYFTLLIANLKCSQYFFSLLAFSTDVYLKREFIESSVSAQQANESVSRCVCVYCVYPCMQISCALFVIGYIPETAAGDIFCCEKVVIIEIPEACVSRCLHTCTHSLTCTTDSACFSFHLRSCSLRQLSHGFLFVSGFLVFDIRLFDALNCNCLFTGASFNHLDPPVAPLFQRSHRRARRRLETPARPRRRSRI